MGSYKKIEEFKKIFSEHALKFPRRLNSNLKSVESDGNYLFETKDCKDSFEVTLGENIRFNFSTKYIKDSYDILGFGRDSELLYECVGVGTSSHVIGSWWVDSSHDIEYCVAINSASEYLLGCDALKHASYSILNKQYDPEAFVKTRDSIVAQLKQDGIYGRFFPPALSMFAYNETVAHENFPMTEDEAKVHGYRWLEDIHVTRGYETMQPDDIPDRIQDVQDSILDEVLRCVKCDRNYRIIKSEIKFYREQNIPVPHKCFWCRHSDRIKLRGPMTLFNRVCMKCGIKIKTIYAEDRPEIVYCENCYQQEVL